MTNRSAEEIVPNIYRLEIPLPESPLKAVNSYLIKGRGHHLVVDCGLRRKECRDAMQVGLDALGIDLRETNFFITHFHADHLGLVSDLATKRATIYLNRPDAARIILPSAQEAFAAGFPPEEIDEVLRAHPGARYGPQLPLPFAMPEDGQVISAGRYNFRCVAAPGHSFGHLCLYEEEQKILLAGDHILGDITPNIQAWIDDWNPLKEYLMSLDRTMDLDVALVLPGHGRVFTDMKTRIEELKEHHARRAEEVLTVLEGGPVSAYQLASGMTWDIDCNSFDLFPASQKWFATGEAIAHLLYLEDLGKVRREETRENTFVWETVKRRS
jgi:glyoxylase-like metal-dependent hydrolase (beta-lactamase superfamily II)